MSYKAQVEIGLRDKASKPWVQMTNKIRSSAQTMAHSVNQSTARMQSAVGRVVGRMTASLRALVPILGAGGLAYAFINAGKEAANFSDQMARVSTMLQSNTMPMMKQFRSAIQKMAVEFGRSTEDLAAGLYNILSAGVPASDAIEHLGAVTRAAIGGFAPLAEVARAVSAIMVGYRHEVTSAAHATDILASIVEGGITTLGELAPNIGMVTSMAADMGIAIEDLAGAIAVVTRTGVGTPMAMTSIRALLTGLKKAPEEAAEEIERLKMAMRSGGMVEFVRTLNAMKLSAEDLTRIFPNVRAAIAIGALKSDMETLQTEIERAANSAGLAEEKFGKMTDNTKFKMAQMKQQLIAVSRQVGEALVPGLLKAGEALMKVFGQKWVQDALVGLGEGVGKLIDYFASLFQKVSEGIPIISNFLAKLVDDTLIGKIIGFLGEINAGIVAIIDNFKALLGEGLQGKLFWVKFSRDLEITFEKVMAQMEKFAAKIAAFWDTFWSTFSFDAATMAAAHAAQDVEARLLQTMGQITRGAQTREDAIIAQYNQAQSKQTEDMLNKARDKFASQQQKEADEAFQRGSSQKYKAREKMIAERMREIEREEMMDRIKGRVKIAKDLKAAEQGAIDKLIGELTYEPQMQLEDLISPGVPSGNRLRKLMSGRRIANEILTMGGVGAAQQIGTFGIRYAGRRGRYIRKFGAEEGMKRYQQQLAREQHLAPSLAGFTERTAAERQMQRVMRDPLGYAKKATGRISELSDAMAGALRAGRRDRAQAISQRIQDLTASRAKVAEPLRGQLENLEKMKEQLEAQGKDIPKELQGRINEIKKAIGDKVETPLDQLKKHMTKETDRMIDAYSKMKPEATAIAIANGGSTQEVARTNPMTPQEVPTSFTETIGQILPSGGGGDVI